MEKIQSMYYTFQQAIVVLGISDSTMRRYLKDKKIPYKQYGDNRKILIPRNAINTDFFTE